MTLKFDNDKDIITLATVIGVRWGMILFSGLILVAYGLTVYLIFSKVIGYWGGLIFISLPVALGLVKDFLGSIPDNADVRAARLDLSFGGLMSVALILRVII